MAPIFSAPLHEQADTAASPPMFVQTFESTEETLPFQLSITEQPQNDLTSTQLVVATPVVQAEAQPSAGVEEVQEELVELEIKAELKWAKS